MDNKENLNESNFYGQILEEENNYDKSNPCDPNNPDYPWVPCGVEKKEDNK